MAREIPLTRGLVTLVDEADYEWLSQWRWCASGKRGRFYAARYGQRKPGEMRPTIRMHRLILGVTETRIQVDHIDRDSLNNQRSNLRVSTHGENQRNQGKHRNNTSGYRGVFRYGKDRWQAQIRVNGRRIHLGYFKDIEDAARAYDAAALEYHGSFANLNLPL